MFCKLLANLERDRGGAHLVALPVFHGKLKMMLAGLRGLGQHHAILNVEIAASALAAIPRCS